LTAPDPTEGVPLLTALNPMALLAVPDPAERVPTDSMALLTAPDLSGSVPTKSTTAFLTAPDLTESVLNPAESMAFFVALDLT
jgi:hypothetical protein